MHVVQRPVRQRYNRRMYSPLERNVVNGVGLGSVDGLFDIGKMFTRLTTFTPSSFKLSNIVGDIGSLTAFTATGGLSVLAPKLTSAHSAAMRDLGYGTIAVAAVAGGAAALASGPAAGATGTGLTTVGTDVGSVSSGSSIIGGVTGTAPASTGIVSTIGSGISSVGSGLMNVVKALPFVSTMLSSGSGVPVQQQDQSQSDAYAQQYANQQAAAAQAAYAQQVAQQQAALYTPGYNPSIPYVSGQYAGAPTPTDSGTSYGDLRSPYTAVAEDGTQVQVDPTTGKAIQPIQASMFPTNWSWTTWLMVGGVLACGLYVAMDNKK